MAAGHAVPSSTSADPASARGHGHAHILVAVGQDARDRFAAGRYPARVIAIQVLVFILGLLGAARVVFSAIRTFVVPRGDNDPAIEAFMQQSFRRYRDQEASLSPSPPR